MLRLAIQVVEQVRRPSLPEKERDPRDSCNREKRERVCSLGTGMKLIEMIRVPTSTAENPAQVVDRIGPLVHVTRDM